MKTTISLNRGFTLVEIMIVVAIIGLLSVIAIQNFNMARKNTQKTTCYKNLKNIDGVKKTYAINERKEGSEEVSLQDLKSHLSRRPVCPGGGEYSLGTVDEKTTCSHHGNVIILIVNTGQTHSNIAEEHGGKREALEGANPGIDNLPEGQRIMIPDNQGRSNGWILPAIGVLILIFILFKPKRKNNLHSKPA
jgi:prepilin-type N-terminal cleavage/methylation domain-containing protein